MDLCNATRDEQQKEQHLGWMAGTESLYISFVFYVGITAMTGNDVNFDGMAPSLLLFATGVFEYMVHLFKGPASRLWNKEECPDKGQQTEYGEEGISPKAGVLYQRGSDQTLQLYIRRNNSKYLICQHTIMKLFSQFEQVLNATPLARRLEGKISDGIAQGTGPHVLPKLNM